MRVLAGQLLTRRGWREGHVRVEGGRVAEVRSGAPQGEVAARGVIVPSFVNAHTHLGDAAARGDALPATLAEAVQPPHGHKHRALAATPEPRLVAAMTEAAREVEASGAVGLVDFREGGARGVAQLRAALQGTALRARILGRPVSLDFTADEVQAVLREAGGIAISSLPDYGEGRAQPLAKAAHRQGKAFALHHAEPGPEPLDPVLSLRPDLLVHLTHASRADIERVRDAGCAVAVCPRSNLRWLRRLPDVRAMLDLGLLPGLGTDNAMLGPCDLLAEARALREAAKDVTPLEVLTMLSFGGRQALNAAGGIEPLEPGAPADLLVFRPAARPEEAVLGPGASLVHRERGPA